MATSLTSGEADMLSEAAPAASSSRSNHADLDRAVSSGMNTARQYQTSQGSACGHGCGVFEEIATSLAWQVFGDQGALTCRLPLRVREGWR